MEFGDINTTSQDTITTTGQDTITTTRYREFESTINRHELLRNHENEAPNVGEDFVRPTNQDLLTQIEDISKPVRDIISGNTPVDEMNAQISDSKLQIEKLKSGNKSDNDFFQDEFKRSIGEKAKITANRDYLEFFNVIINAQAYLENHKNKLSDSSLYTNMVNSVNELSALFNNEESNLKPEFAVAFVKTRTAVIKYCEARSGRRQSKKGRERQTIAYSLYYGLEKYILNSPKEIRSSLIRGIDASETKDAKPTNRLYYELARQHNGLLEIDSKDLNKGYLDSKELLIVKDYFMKEQPSQMEQFTAAFIEDTNIFDSFRYMHISRGELSDFIEEELKHKTYNEIVNEFNSLDIAKITDSKDAMVHCWKKDEESGELLVDDEGNFIRDEEAEVELINRWGGASTKWNLPKAVASILVKRSKGMLCMVENQGMNGYNLRPSLPKTLTIPVSETRIATDSKNGKKADAFYAIEEDFNIRKNYIRMCKILSQTILRVVENKIPGNSVEDLTFAIYSLYAKSYRNDKEYKELVKIIFDNAKDLLKNENDKKEFLQFFKVMSSISDNIQKNQLKAFDNGLEELSMIAEGFITKCGKYKKYKESTEEEKNKIYDEYSELLLNSEWGKAALGLKDVTEIDEKTKQRAVDLVKRAYHELEDELDNTISELKKTAVMDDESEAVPLIGACSASAKFSKLIGYAVFGPVDLELTYDAKLTSSKERNITSSYILHGYNNIINVLKYSMNPDIVALKNDTVFMEALEKLKDGVLYDEPVIEADKTEEERQAILNHHTIEISKIEGFYKDYQTFQDHHSYQVAGLSGHEMYSVTTEAFAAETSQLCTPIFQMDSANIGIYKNNAFKDGFSNYYAEEIGMDLGMKEIKRFIKKRLL